jgi:hypothetical protein
MNETCKRRTRVRLAITAVAMASATGCGAPAAPVAPVAPPPAAPAVAPPAPVALAEIPPPADLSMTAVVPHPKQSFDALESLVHGTTQWKTATSMAGAVGAAELASSLDLDSPIVIAAVGQDPAAAITVLPGAAPALAERLHLEPSKDGGFRTRPAGAGGKKKGDDGPPIACAIMPAPGDSQRLVCAQNDATLDRLGPYLATKKLDARGSGLHVEIDAQPVRSAILDGMKDDSGDPADKSTVLVQNAAKEQTSDIDRFVLDLGLDGGVDLTVGVRFRTTSSVFTRLMTAHPDRAAPAQPAFWRLPSDTNMAFYSQGSAPSDLEGVRTLLLGALDDELKEASCSEEVEYARERIRAIFLTGGPFVVGIGNDVPEATKAVDAFRALPKETAAARTRTRLALENWALLEVDEPASRWEGPVRDLALADRKFHDCKPANPPKVAKKPKDHTTTEVVAVTAAQHLPKGSLHIVSRTTPIAKDAPPAHTSHLFMVPDGEHTWFAMGENEPMVLTRVKRALEGAPAEGTLATRRGLDGLRSESVAAGGFVTVEGVSLLGINDDTGEQMRAMGKKLADLAALPEKGTVPIPLLFRTTPREVSTRVVVPPVALKEILALLNP